MDNETRSKCQLLASRREFVQGTLGIAAMTTLAIPFRYAYATGVTGDFAIDFTSLQDSDPYTNNDLTSIDNLPVRIAAGALSPSSGAGSPYGLRRYRFNGSIAAGSTIRAKVQVGTATAFDLIHAAILAADGSGYFLVINQTTVGVQIVDAAGNTAGLIGGTAASAAPGDIFTLEWVPATHTLTGYLNGVAIPNVSIVDSNFSTGLAFGFAFDAENHNGSTVQSFAGDGGTSSGGGGGPPTYTPWILADFGNLTTDAATDANNNHSGNFPASVYATFAAGYGSSRSTAFAYPGKTTSLQMSIPAGSDGDDHGDGAGVGKGLYGVKVNFPTLLVAGQAVHAQVRIYVPTGFAFSPAADFLKFMRFDTEVPVTQDGKGLNGVNFNDINSGTWGNDGHGGPFHGVTIDGQLNFNSEPGNPDVNIWTTGNLNKGVWQEFEFEVKLGAGTTGAVKVWQKISGVWTLILALDNTPTLADPTDVCGVFLVHTYFNGNSPQTQSDYLDRVVVEYDLSKLTQTDAAGNKIIGESV
jgi:hypothetical protein